MVVPLPSVVVFWVLPHAETAVALNVIAAAAATPPPRNRRREVSGAKRVSTGESLSSGMGGQSSFGVVVFQVDKVGWADRR